MHSKVPYVRPCMQSWSRGRERREGILDSIPLGKGPHPVICTDAGTVITGNRSRFALQEWSQGYRCLL